MKFILNKNTICDNSRSVLAVDRANHHTTLIIHTQTGAIPKTHSVLDDLDEGGRANYEQSRAERNARKTERDGGPNSAYTRGGDQFFHSGIYK